MAYPANISIRRYHLVMLAVLVSFAPTPALAQGYGEADWGISSSTLSDMIQADIINRNLEILQDAAGISGDDSSGGKQGKTSPAPKKNPLDVRWSLSVSGDDFSSGTGVEQLAHMFPKEEYYKRMGHFRRGILQLGDVAETTYGIPKFNLATGMTAAVAGAYAAYTGQVMPDSYVKPLYQQLDRKMRAEPDVVNAKLSAKATSYQLNMGMGLLLTGMHVEAQQGANAKQRAQLRALGAATLQSIFGVEANRIQFSNNGYSIR